MTLAVKVALNPNTVNQSIHFSLTSHVTHECIFVNQSYHVLGQLDAGFMTFVFTANFGVDPEIISKLPATRQTALATVN